MSKKITVEKTRRTKTFISLDKTKTTKGTAKAGCTCLYFMILDEFAILMRHEKCDFKNWTLIVSLLKRK